MATIRPVISVYNLEGKVAGSLATPSAFAAPIRPDLVRYTITQMAKNHRQAYAVSKNSGYQTSAESWGTGRAVARIPRVSGGGTHRAGQGAFGNMCRDGGMFAPTRVWRRWHRKVNVTQKRHALACALAATAIPAIVESRGHRISNVPEMPLVLTNEAQSVGKTKQAAAILAALGANEDVERCKDSKKVHTGRGKSRNRRYTMRRGPLVVYAEDEGISKAFRNISGVEVCSVERLNLLKVAPGGSMGRFCIYTEGAMKRIQALFGNYKNGSVEKKGYFAPRAILSNADVAGIINSNEVQSVLNAQKMAPLRRTQHKNPLKNYSVLCRLNPAYKKQKLTAKAALKKD